MKLQDTIRSASSGGAAPTPKEHVMASTAPLQDIPAAPLPDVGHVDYNLHPLKVSGLDHYIEQPAWEVRFRIS